MKSWIKKILIVCGAGVVTAFFGLWLFFTAAFSVGHINFMLAGGALKDIAKLAPAMPVKPGESMYVELRDDKLVPVEISHIKVTRKTGGQLLVVFYRGGGHLGMMGYVYCDDTRVSNIREVAGYSESVEFRRLRDHWWSYDSLEDN